MSNVDSLLDLGDDPFEASSSRQDIDQFPPRQNDPFDPFGTVEEEPSGGTHFSDDFVFDPFASSPVMSSQNHTAGGEQQQQQQQQQEDSAMSNSEQKAYEDQFADLLGDLGPSGQNGVSNGLMDTGDVTTTTTEVTSDEGGVTTTTTKTVIDTSGQASPQLASQETVSTTWISPTKGQRSASMDVSGKVEVTLLESSKVTKPSGDAKPGAIKPDASKPEVTKPEAGKPEVTKPVATIPEVTKPAPSKPEVSKSVASKAEVTKPEASKPEVQKAEASKPEVKKDEANKPEVKKVEASKPEVVKPETGHTPDIKVSNSDSIELKASQPDISKPEVGKPEARKPEASKPEASKAADSKASKPEAVESKQPGAKPALSPAASSSTVAPETRGSETLKTSLPGDKTPSGTQSSSSDPDGHATTSTTTRTTTTSTTTVLRRQASVPAATLSGEGPGAGVGEDLPEDWDSLTSLPSAFIPRARTAVGLAAISRRVAMDKQQSEDLQEGPWEDGRTERGIRRASLPSDLVLNAAAKSVEGSGGWVEQAKDGVQDGSASKDEKKAMEYMKDRYEGPNEKKLPKIIREPKKLDVQWGKQSSQDEAKADDLKSPTLPKEQDLVTYTSLGTDYSKKQYESKVERDRLSRQNSADPTKPGLVPVNKQVVEKVAPPEITKNVRAMFESGHLPDRHEVKKTKVDIPVVVPGSPAAACVFENEPLALEGVVRGNTMDGENDSDVLSPGVTKNLLKEWQKKADGPDDGDQVERPKINMAEGEGQVLENEPEVRSDVMRESDFDAEYQAPAAGSSVRIKQQLAQKMADAERQKERKVVRLVEDNDVGPVVYENEPARREGVVRSDDQADDVAFERGNARKLASRFLEEERDTWTERKPIVIERDTEPIVLENEPEALADGVVRGSDAPDSDRDVQLQRGHSRKIASLFSEKQEDNRRGPREQIKLDLAENGPTVLENEPEQVGEDVVRSGLPSDDVFVARRGHIRNLAGRFAETDEDDKPRGLKPMIQIERSEEPSVLENQPAPPREDVVRSDAGDRAEEAEPVAGRTRNLRSVWSNMENEPTTPKSPPGGKSKWQMEIEQAKDSGVYENTPEQRDDLVREDSEFVAEQQIIPQGQAKNLRSQWLQKLDEEEKEKQSPATPELVRFTPPREMTPPSVKQSDFQSVQQLQLSGGQAPGGQQVPGGQLANGPPQAGGEAQPTSTGTPVHYGQPNAQAPQQQKLGPRQPPKSKQEEYLQQQQMKQKQRELLQQRQHDQLLMQQKQQQIQQQQMMQQQQYVEQQQMMQQQQQQQQQQPFDGQYGYDGQPQYNGQQPYDDHQQHYDGQQPYGQHYDAQQPYGQPYDGQQPYDGPAESEEGYTPPPPPSQTVKTSTVLVLK